MKIRINLPRAFTLVELLVVIAIMMVVLGITAAGVSSFNRSYDYTKSISQISSYLEIARAESMSKNMWTWVGLKETNESGTPVLLLAAVGSKNGTDDRLGTNNLFAVAKPIRLPNVGLQKITQSVASILDGTSYAFTWNVGGTSVDFTDTVIAISPQGEILTKNGNLPPWIEVGVIQMHGNQPNPAQKCSILVSGVSGQILVVRP